MAFDPLAQNITFYICLEIENLVSMDVLIVAQHSGNLSQIHSNKWFHDFIPKDK